MCGNNRTSLGRRRKGSPGQRRPHKLEVWKTAFGEETAVWKSVLTGRLRPGWKSMAS